MEKNRKMPTEREMIEQLRRGEVSLPPLSFRFLEGQPVAEGNRPLDAFVEVRRRMQIHFDAQGVSGWAQPAEIIVAPGGLLAHVVSAFPQ
jgi:hypothetical protein